MKNKTLTAVAALLMVVLAAGRGVWAGLLIAGRIDDAMIIARRADVFSAAINQMLISLLLLLAGLSLFVWRGGKSYLFCLLMLLLFVLGGLGNAYILYGSPPFWGQAVNFAAAGIIAAILLLAQRGGEKE